MKSLLFHTQNVIRHGKVILDKKSNMCSDFESYGLREYFDSLSLFPSPAGLENFVRIATPAGALSDGVPDSYKKPSRLRAFAVQTFFAHNPQPKTNKDRFFGAPDA